MRASTADKRHRRHLAAAAATRQDRKKLAKTPWAGDGQPAHTRQGTSIPGGTTPDRHRLLQHRWKAGYAETRAAVEAAESWSKKLVPLCNKGALGLVTSRAEALELGKK